MSAYTILGIDPGYGRMGFGLILADGRAYEAIDYGVMKTTAGEDTPSRLLALAHDLESVVSAHPPHLLAIEKLFFSTNQKTALQVAEARGVVLLTAAQYGIPVVEFTPMQVKTSLTGDGKAGKPAMQRMVKQLLNLPTIPKPDDAADALALAITASSTVRRLVAS